MSYTKQVWSDNNPAYPASAVRFAHIEDGIYAAATTAVTTVNAMAYGAAGDGATDDTAAITSALATGRDVFLPAGTYIVNELKFAVDHQRLVGQGRTHSMLKAKAGVAAYVIAAQGIRGWGLEDITLDGNGGSKGLYFAAAAGSTSQDPLTKRVYVQNCSIGIHIDNVGVTQADKNTFLNTGLVGNAVGFQSDCTNSQETIFIGVDCGFTANNQVGFKLNASGGGACLGILGGQCQGNGANTGLVGIQVTGVNLGWVWLKDYIDENVQTSIDGSVSWPNYGVILEHVALQGTTANVLMGPVNAGTVGGVLHAKCCVFRGTGGTGLGGNGIIKNYSTDLTYAYGYPKVYLQDCNITGNPPLIQANSGAALPLVPGESPRLVGGSSQPTFASDWTNFASGYRSMMFYMDRSGLVHVEGNVTTPGGQAGDSTIFTLPVGYRPVAGSRVTASGTVISTNAYCRIDVDSSGNVKQEAAISAGGAVGFSISFMPAA